MLKFVAIVVFGVHLSGFAQEVGPLKLSEADQLAKVPLECVHKEYPNKLNQVLADSTHIQSPSELHPIFYGCFDWHSSVHGHWLMARIMNKFPESQVALEISTLFDQQFQVPNVQKELLYFMPKMNRSFERTYGWAWYLKLIEELHQSPINDKHGWTKNLQSLTDQIVKSYKAFLPKLLYPIRIGEHNNTAFGLSLALDYARSLNDTEFEQLITERSKTYYLNDEGCPINWEPGGFDFISPCLQEAELMSKILDEKEFKKWVVKFMPAIADKEFTLAPGKVVDRTDGKLVHLDGLNFSRAWCLYTISQKLPDKYGEPLVQLADEHIMASKPHVIGSDYMGSHWLATFLVYALESRNYAE